MTPGTPPVYRLATADDVARAGAAGPPQTDAPAAGGGPRAWWRSRTARVIAVVLAVFMGLPVAVVTVWVIRVTVQAGQGADVPPVPLPSSPVGTGASSGPPGSPRPSVSPSPDLLRNPREMLRCGPRDPFRQWHDCPSSAPAR